MVNRRGRLTPPVAVLLAITFALSACQAQSQPDAVPTPSPPVVSATAELTPGEAFELELDGGISLRGSAKSVTKAGTATLRSEPTLDPAVPGFAADSAGIQLTLDGARLRGELDLTFGELSPASGGVPALAERSGTTAWRLELLPTPTAQVQAEAATSAWIPGRVAADLWLRPHLQDAVSAATARRPAPQCEDAAPDWALAAVGAQMRSCISGDDETAQLRVSMPGAAPTLWRVANGIDVATPRVEGGQFAALATKSARLPAGTLWVPSGAAYAVTLQRPAETPSSATLEVASDGLTDLTAVATALLPPRDGVPAASLHALSLCAPKAPQQIRDPRAALAYLTCFVSAVADLDAVKKRKRAARALARLGVTTDRARLRSNLAALSEQTAFLAAVLKAAPHRPFEALLQKARRNLAETMTLELTESLVALQFRPAVQVSTRRDLADLDQTDPAFAEFALALVKSLEAEDPDCAQPAVVSVQAYRSDGWAAGTAGRCGGYMAIWSNQTGTWRQVIGGQETYPCARLRELGVPSGLVQRCAIRGGAEAIPYEGPSAAN